MLRIPSAIFHAILIVLLLGGPLAAAEKPRLIVLVVLDQVREDYMTRHAASFVPGGFRLLRERGAVFTQCSYLHAGTLTAPGHAVIATGTDPMVNGIVGNEWFDRAAGARTTADRDPNQKLLGAVNASPGASPHWLKGSTLADELRLATGSRGRVISIAPKARSAIIPGGHGANAAYWFDKDTGFAISSTYYMAELPAWVHEFNSRDWVEKYAGQPWTPVDNPKGEPFLTFPTASNDGERQKLSRAVDDSAFLTDIQFAFARAAVVNEKLGGDEHPDLLALSLSALDHVGHDFGPDSPRTHDTIFRADRALAEFLQFLDQQIGLNNVWIALTADHGVAPMPEVARGLRLDAGRIANPRVTGRIEEALNRAYPAAGHAGGEGDKDDKWVENYSVPNLYLNQKRIQRRGLDPAEVERRAAAALMELRAFTAVFTRSALTGCRPSSELIGKVCRSWSPARSGDLYLVFKPYWMYELLDNSTGTTHGSPWSYDAHVPLVFFGAAFRPGAYHTPASPADLPVTLAAALGISAPAQASGRVLVEALNPDGVPAAVRQRKAAKAR